MDVHVSRTVVNLHCTKIHAVSDALPHSLLASHLYSPASFLFMFVNPSSLESVRVWSSTLIQDTIDEGIPDALHDRVTLPPSVIVALCIGFIEECTANKHIYMNMKYNLH